jgi:hypothetical protein
MSLAKLKISQKLPLLIVVMTVMASAIASIIGITLAEQEALGRCKA